MRVNSSTEIPPDTLNLYVRLIQLPSASSRSLHSANPLINRTRKISCPIGKFFCGQHLLLDPPSSPQGFYTSKVELSIAFIPLPFIAETVLALTPVEGRCVTANQDLRQTFREATHEIPGNSCIDLSLPTFCQFRKGTLARPF